jgi:recombination protein RecA
MTDFNKILSEVNKKFGKNKVVRIGDETKEKAPVIETDSLAVNFALNGGFARGKIIEIFGAEQSGKTTLALHALGKAQQQGLISAFIDMEHALNLEYAEQLGVDVENLLFSQPDHGDEVFGIIEELIKLGVNFFVIDSVAAMVPKAELEGEYGESKMGLHARLMSQGMRKLTGLASKKEVTLIFINQTRVKIGVMFGDPTTTTGGEALKFYASQRLNISASTKIKDENGEIIGQKTTVKVVKNKIGIPHKKTEYILLYGIGIDILGELIDIATELEVIKKSGSWYSYQDNKLGQGTSALRKTLEDNPELLQSIKTECGL